ncbi:MAG: ubiquitin-like domain-containing protein [Kineosporiaceae bacterium]
MPGPSKVWSDVFRLLASRSGRLLAQGTVLSAVVGATLAYADAGTSLNLSVDGQTRQVQAGATTVRELLAAEAITLGEYDLVAPALDTRLTDGQDVVVRYARPLAVTVDGVPKIYQTTELTVDGALAALGIRADGARLSVSRSQPLGRTGLAVSVSTPKQVTVAADGATRTVSTTAATVSELLGEQRLALGSLDQVSVKPAAPLAKGMTVTVVRVTRREAVKVEAIPYRTTKKTSKALAPGTTKVITKGSPGVQRVTYTITVADGKPVSSVRSAAVVSKQPVHAVLQVGPKAAPAATSAAGSGSSATGTSADGLNWPALAKCESGGNPRAVNPAGYYGLYQFSLSTWRSVGGSGNPINASPGEQLTRAKILYSKAGAGQWGCGRHLFD